MRDELADPLGGGLGGGGVALRQQQRQLVAAESRQQLAGADGRGGAASDRDEHVVAGLMAPGVVDELEAVEIYQRQAEVAAVAAGALGLAAQPFLEGALVGEPGQRVGRRLRRQGAARLGVGERRGDQLGEVADAVLDARPERHVGQHGDEAPDMLADADRRADAMAEGAVAGVAVGPRRQPAAQRGGDAAGLQREQTVERQRLDAVAAPAADHARMALVLVADDRAGVGAEGARDLGRDERVHDLRVGALGDRRGDVAQRSALAHVERALVLVGGDGGEIVQRRAVLLAPRARAPVVDAERAEDRAVATAQRRGDAGDRVERGDRGPAAQARRRAHVGDGERPIERGGRRARQRVLEAVPARPRVGQAAAGRQQMRAREPEGGFGGGRRRPSAPRTAISATGAPSVRAATRASRS